MGAWCGAVGCAVDEILSWSLVKAERESRVFERSLGTPEEKIRGLKEKVCMRGERGKRRV